MIFSDKVLHALLDLVLLVAVVFILTVIIYRVGDFILSALL